MTPARSTLSGFTCTLGAYVALTMASCSTGDSSPTRHDPVAVVAQPAVTTTQTIAASPPQASPVEPADQTPKTCKDRLAWWDISVPADTVRADFELSGWDDGKLPGYHLACFTPPGNGVGRLLASASGEHGPLVIEGLLSQLCGSVVVQCDFGCGLRPPSGAGYNGGDFAGHVNATLTSELGCPHPSPSPSPSPTPPPSCEQTETCPVACVVSGWGEWVTTSSTDWSQCVNGEQSRTLHQARTRTVLTPPSNGGAQCPSLTETRDVPETRSCSVPYCYYRVSCGQEGRCTDQSQQTICEATQGGTPPAPGVWLNFGPQNLQNHCRYAVPGVSLDNFQLNPGQSDPACLDKND